MRPMAKRNWRMWAVISPTGHLRAVEESATLAIAHHNRNWGEERTDYPSQRIQRLWYREGYRCIRVKVEEEP